MEALILEGNSIYPNVIFEPENGYFEISGNSVMEDADFFYTNLLDQLELYSKKPKSFSKFIFNFENFNITSSKRILFILYKLSEIKRAGKTVSIAWFYDKSDDSMLESGKDFEFMVDIPFEYHHCHKVKTTSLL